MNKSDFPIFKTYATLAYLDNASTTQKPQSVIDEIVKYYETSNANVHRGIYKLSEIATDIYEDARNMVAQFLNAESTEIIFTSGTTDSVNSLAAMLEEKFNEGDAILTTTLEHHSNLLPFQRLSNKKKLRLEYLSLDEIYSGIDVIKSKIQSIPNLKLVSISAMSNVLGVKLPVKEITKIAKEIGALISVDAAQLAAHEAIDVKDLDVDFLSLSGHKIYGPTGIGVLYINKKHHDLEPAKVGGGVITEVTRDHALWRKSPDRFEAGTPNIEGAAGLKAAIDFINSIGFEKIREQDEELTQYAFERLAELNFIDVYSKSGENHSSVIALNVKGVHAHDTADILGQNDVAVRAGHHCCQILMKEELHVQSTIRVSFGVYNTNEDIDKLINGLKKVNSILI